MPGVQILIPVESECERVWPCKNKNFEISQNFEFILDISIFDDFIVRFCTQKIRLYLLWYMLECNISKCKIGIMCGEI